MEKINDGMHKGGFYFFSFFWKNISISEIRPMKINFLKISKYFNYVKSEKRKFDYESFALLPGSQFSLRSTYCNTP